MARTTCTMKKVLGNGKKQLWPKKHLQVMRAMPRRSVGGRAHCCDSMEIEGGQSPLTTPPSSPVPMEEEAAECFRVSSTHNRVSGIVLITYFVEFCFFALVLLFLSGWWYYVLLQPVQKGSVHICHIHTFPSRNSGLTLARLTSP